VSEEENQERRGHNEVRERVLFIGTQFSTNKHKNGVPIKKKQ
jgi:hypothetical protein